MSFTYQRQYRGKIQAVLLDWAGTTMDYGCMAPAVVFVEVYRRQGVPISMDEARAPMGAHKRVHIQKIGQLDSVRQRWHEKHGRAPTEADVDRMFSDFVPLQLACLSEYSEMIPGALEAPERVADCIPDVEAAPIAAHIALIAPTQIPGHLIARVEAAGLDQGRSEAERHRGVVGPFAGLQAERPAADHVGERLERTAWLEFHGGPNGVTDCKAEQGAEDAVGIGHRTCRVDLSCPAWLLS